MRDLMLKFHWYEEDVKIDIHKNGTSTKTSSKGNKYEVIIAMSNIFISLGKLEDRSIGHYVYVKSVSSRMWISKTTYDELSRLLQSNDPVNFHDLTAGEGA